MKKSIIFMLLILSFLFLFLGCSYEETSPLPESEIPAEEQPSEPEKYEPNINMDKSIINNAEREMDDFQWKKEFEEIGINVTLQNTRFTDEHHFEGEFLLSRFEDENKLIIPITGIYADGGFTLILGTFVFTNDYNIAYCGKDKVVIFDAYSLEENNFVPNLPKSEKELWVNNIFFDLANEK